MNNFFIFSKKTSQKITTRARISIKTNQFDLLTFFSFCLFFLAGVYLIKGFYCLIISGGFLEDLHLRWQEQQDFYQKRFPENISEVNKYLPWSFFTGFFLFPPLDWELTRFYHVILNFISLVILAYFAYNLGLPYGKNKAFFSLAATLAISSNGATLMQGQFGIIINAFLIAMLSLLEKRQDLIAGIILGIAAIQPNFSGLYLLLSLIRNRLKIIITFSLYLIYASINIWILTKINPLVWLISSLENSEILQKNNSLGIDLFLNLGLSTQDTIFLSIILACLIILIIGYFKTNYCLLNLFAVTCVVSRIYLYHENYDNVMLIFLLFVLLKITWKNYRKLNIFALITFAISLWLPEAVSQLPLIANLQQLIWLAALIYVLLQEKFNKLTLNKMRALVDNKVSY